MRKMWLGNMKINLSSSIYKNSLGIFRKDIKYSVFSESVFSELYLIHGKRYVF